MNGLTAVQDWTHSHIVRCSCGSWEVVTQRELAARAKGKPAPVPCKHINDALEAQQEAS